MRCLFLFFAEALLVGLEFLGPCGHGDAGGWAPLLAQKWGMEGTM
jgi:hypothetical protein